jgi:hypothetical protein
LWNCFFFQRPRLIGRVWQTLWWLTPRWGMGFPLWPDHAQPGTPFVRTATGNRFTSKHFRNSYLYPWLQMLKEDGDPLLRAFTDAVGNRISDKFYSVNSFCRGGRSHVSKRRTGKWKATEPEIYEHGLWHMKQKNENMPTRYWEFTLEDRLMVTLMCM